MKKFRLVDNIFGWVAFLIAAVTYCCTIEPTASFWDCPEFIVTGYKLEVGHPPGAPFFMLTANLFSQLVSDPSQVARMVNTMNALLSATCIMFLFWTITHLTRRLILKDWSELNLSKLIAIEASGLVGALIYTFSDTFWYSAVEGEVYAYSSAFTAVVFWLILKWEDNADKPHSDRWLVLITYMTGLSIGVHLLNLLCIPAIVLVYYYKRVPEADLKGSLIALAVSFAIVAAVLYGVIPGIITMGGWFELFFVNTLGMSFNTGLIIYIILLICVVLWAIYETQTDKSILRQNIAFTAAVGLIGLPFYGYGWKAVITGVVVLTLLWVALNWKKGALISARVKNTTLLCMLMLMIGYSTYAVIVIRSSANPPMDQNSPEDIFALGTYMSREQYGDRPLFYGPAYSSEPKIAADGMRYETVDGGPVYQRKEKASPDEKDSYFIVRNKTDYIYEQNMLFPRMYSAAHRGQYESWMGGIQGRDVDGVTIPTQLENLRFFLSYQCNFMYWRYFMWNFAGRQNDIQGNGELEHGNWITGISFIDNILYGNQDLLPDELKENKGHNVFYCLPLLLGLIGLFWQAWRGKRGIQQFWVVAFLFFMTGLAIVVYLNQTPSQPRERDYAYAGSFYAYAIWCGLGVAAIIDTLKKYLKGVNPVAIASVIAIATIFIPIQMASQTWDDHDRSGRYTCRDFGQNYLMSLQQEGNPIIYTNGDNDTFPLWYNQEAEGVRTDARVCNLSYLQTDWYIDQMTRPAYDSPALPITWPRLDYVSGTNEYIPIDTRAKEEILAFYRENPEAARQQFGDEPFELKNILKYWVRSKDEETHFIPTDTLYLTIDKEAVHKSGMMMASDSIPDKMIISLQGKRALYKGDLMMLEMIANANWTRPIYVALTVGSENYMNLGDNFIQEGLVNRITPFTTKGEGVKDFDTEKTYDAVMNRFKWGGLSTPGLYLDETVTRMCHTHRRLLAQLAARLVEEGKTDKAKKVLAKMEKEIPEYNVPMSYIMSGGADIAITYAQVGEKAKAMKLIDKMWKNSLQYVNYYLSLGERGFGLSQSDCFIQFRIMMSLLQTADEIDTTWDDKHEPIIQSLLDRYQQRGGRMPE
ncbi:MAG: DUF2723 domain-containing protein [Prevotella sp.]|nr:DUF2723 domain-containing protein [Prevotella sp.]